MQTDRLFVGDIYLYDVCIKHNAILVYFKNKGYVNFDIIKDDSEIRFLDKNKIADIFITETQNSKGLSIDLNSIRPFLYSGVQALKNIDVKYLRKITSEYKKSNQ